MLDTAVARRRGEDPSTTGHGCSRWWVDFYGTRTMLELDTVAPDVHLCDSDRADFLRARIYPPTVIATGSGRPSKSVVPAKSRAPTCPTKQQPAQRHGVVDSMLCADPGQGGPGSAARARGRGIARLDRCTRRTSLKLGNVLGLARQAGAATKLRAIDRTITISGVRKNERR